MPHQDDPSFCGAIMFYRRIPPKGDRVKWGEDGKPIPTTQNFKDKRNQLSVFLAHETTPENVLDGHLDFGLVHFAAQAVRDVFVAFGQAVIICRDDEDPANGHVLICGNITDGMAKKLRTVAQWVEGKWPKRLGPDSW